MRSKRALITRAAGTIAAAAALVSVAAAGSDATRPEFQFDGRTVRFVDRITNPFFPLIPGTKFFYRGKNEGKPSSDILFVTYKTKEILGVTCTVVSDQAFENGILKESTADWYAQDTAGNVWYFGEDTKEFDAEGNVVSTAGSWQAGRDGAMPGIIMKAHPTAGDRYHQEFAPGVAEDAAQVVGIKPGCVPYGCFDEILTTHEWTRLAPDALDRKRYAKGVGFVAGESLKGGDEYLALVYVTTQPPSEAP